MDELVNIQVGLLGRSFEISSMLKQEGVPYFEHDPRVSGSLDGIGSMLIIDKVTGRDTELLKVYLRKKGAIICDVLNKELISALCAKRLDRGDNAHDECIELYESGGGHVIYVSKYLRRSAGDRNAVVKEFYTSAGIVRERVALFPGYRDRDILSRALMMSFHVRGLPFVRLWYYPKSCKSVFNFRFDLDEDTGNDLEHIAEASKEFKDCTTWFVSCASFEKNAHKIKRLIDDGFDVQSHGYYHHTYGDRSQNELNIRKSIDYIAGLSGLVEGFAAPMGRWNEGLQLVLERLGLLYSSEFSLDYDDLPFYPVLHGRPSSVLQIPIHPICWGIYKDAGIGDDNAIKEYMQKVIINKHYARLPVLIYGHPSESIGKNPALLKAIYKTAGSLSDVSRVRLSDLAKWWRNRDKVRFKDVVFNASKKTISYAIKGGTHISDLCLNIQIKPDKVSYHSIAGPCGEICLDGLKYEEIRNLKADPDLYREAVCKKSRLKRLKEGVVAMLDWEECTPLGEIKRNSIASNLKYVLRRCGFDKVKLNV